MHILHVTPYYAPAYAFGGVASAVEGMSRALVRCGHTVTVLSTDALNQTQRYNGNANEMVNGVRVVRVPNLSVRLRGRANLSTPHQMKRVAAELLPDADIVHCHEFRTLENLLVTPLAVGLGKPLVLSPHGTLSLKTGRGRLKKMWDRLLSSAVAQRFDHVIGLTQREVEEIQALWPTFGRRRRPAQFSVIPNGIDPEEFALLTGRETFRERYGLGDAVVCLFMGRLHRRKGVDLLVRAFQQANVPGAKLVVAGPDEGMLDSLKPLLDERTIITGFLTGEERLAAFAGSDVLVLPATGEGLPIVVLEAMGAGLPVIISPGCNLPEVAAYGAGIEVEPTLEPLTEALRALLTDEDQRATMGAAGRKLVEECFTWDTVAQQLVGVYEKYG